MNLHAIVPVKELPQAKSRLHPTLSPLGRQSLVREMLTRVVTTLRNCGFSSPTPHEPQAQGDRVVLSTIWVVSRDPEVLALAAELGANPLPEQGYSLNGALEQARSAARAAAADALLIIPADLPLVTCADIIALAHALLDGADLVLAPDAAEQGTNALGLWISTDLPFRFGPASFQIHRAHAAWNELIVAFQRSPTLALDVDTPPNLIQYRAAS